MKTSESTVWAGLAAELAIVVALALSSIEPNNGANRTRSGDKPVKAVITTVKPPG